MNPSDLYAMVGVSSGRTLAEQAAYRGGYDATWIPSDDWDAALLVVSPVCMTLQFADDILVVAELVLHCGEVDAEERQAIWFRLIDDLIAVDVPVTPIGPFAAIVDGDTLMKLNVVDAFDLPRVEAYFYFFGDELHWTDLAIVGSA